MYIYNVTINIDESVCDKWLNWMKDVHIPEMLKTGKFSKALMSQVLINEEMGGVTYSVQFTCDSKETLEKYYLEDAQKLRGEGHKLFKNKFGAFRTEMKVIKEFV
jgi:uncharacterized protein DUF4286